MSFEENHEEPVICLIISHNKVDEAIEGIFKSHLSRYQIGLET